MSLCVLAGTAVLALQAEAFTLGWTHSTAQTRWEEDWSLDASKLTLHRARVRGSGAGMEPPEGAALADGWWVWTPTLPPQPELVLAASGATGNGWTLCIPGRCLELGAEPGPPIRIAPCPGAGGATDD